ncbi:MAG: methyltransferase domain-containing protein [[Ruminococcus] gnavus]|nr:methyltransferase domain-containing protein [Mediterraneibacter gnavus]
MKQDELQWDKLLRIKTTGRDDTHSNQYCYPYEPTPYCVLERMANYGILDKKNVLLDYGTGKGRVCFFLSYQTRCHTIGIEYDERIFNAAKENERNAASGRMTSFIEEHAEEYVIPAEVDCCYFFNPFSVELLRKVLAKIYDSCYANAKSMRLFFYYPSDEYVSCLMTQEQLQFVDEIDCRDLFPGNDPREKILIFEVFAMTGDI